MHKKHLGHEYLSDLQTNLCYLLNARMKKLLSNTVELKMKYLEGRSMDGKIYEWTVQI